MDVTIPAEYGYVFLVAIASTFVNQWHGIVVTGKRMAAKVPYPNAYAAQAEAPHGSAKYAFNCAQRTHANYIENLPNFYIPLGITGVLYPKFAAVSGFFWLAGRIVYTLGYVNSVKEAGKGRYYGAPIWYPAQIALWGGACYVAYQMVTGA